MPFAVATIHAPPRSASPTRRSLGSPTMHASWTSRPRSSRTLVPYRPMCSSSAARWNVKVPARSMPARRIAAAAASADATGPFMSAEPRPINLPSSTTPAQGSCRQFARSPTGTTSRWPFHARDGRSPEPIDATTLGRCSSPRIVSGDAPIPVRMSVATAAASSSVPPGFSLGAAISARANARTSSASTAAAAASAMSSSTMANDGTRDPVANGTARFARAGSIALARRTAIAWRPSSPRSSRRPSRRSCSRCARAGCRATPARSRSPEGCRIPASRWVRRRSARRSRRSGWTRRRRS